MRVKVKTSDRFEILDITSKVKDQVDIDDGICTVFVPHTTAGVTINENERRLISDMKDVLSKLVPQNDGYKHDTIDSNADAHLKSILLGSSVSIPVEKSELSLGTWQSILFVEGDGPRSRNVVVKTV